MQKAHKRHHQITCNPHSSKTIIVNILTSFLPLCTHFNQCNFVFYQNTFYILLTKNNISMYTVKKVLLHVISLFYFLFCELSAHILCPFTYWVNWTLTLDEVMRHLLLIIIYFEEISTIPFQSSNALVYQGSSYHWNRTGQSFHVQYLPSWFFNSRNILRGCSDPNEGVENNLTSTLTTSDNFRMKATQARRRPPNTQLPATKSLGAFPVSYYIFMDSSCWEFLYAKARAGCYGFNTLVNCVWNSKIMFY